MCTTRLIEHLVNETRALGLVRENVRREPNLVLACEAHSKAQLLLSRLRCASLAGALPCDAALALHTRLTIRLRLVMKKGMSQFSVRSFFPPALALHTHLTIRLRLVIESGNEEMIQRRIRRASD